MEQTTVHKCQELIGYQFQDETLLSLALTHASVVDSRTQSNERLEFLGDAVLDIVVCHNLYEHEDQMLEGAMTKIKSAVVSGVTCAEIAEDMGISELLFTGKGMTLRKLPKSVSAAVLEAIIGAVYLDGGLEPARKLILRQITPHITEALTNEHQHNYKSVLQQHVQHDRSVTPEYHLLDEKGPDHSKAFEISASVDGRHFPSAWGKTKRQAEQEAARRALLELGLLEEAEDE